MSRARGLALRWAIWLSAHVVAMLGVATVFAWCQRRPFNDAFPAGLRFCAVMAVGLALPDLWRAARDRAAPTNGWMDKRRRRVP